jgi:acetyltransferase-like isoleucine patch superfamily enzyme
MRRIYNFFLVIYYQIRFWFLRLVVGENAWEYLLHDSLFPILVLKMAGAEVGRNVRIGRWLVLHESQGSFNKLNIGDGVYIGKNVTIDLTDNVNIGNRCAIGMNVQIITHSNFGDSQLKTAYQKETTPVTIGDDCIINWGAIVLKGTLMEDRVIVLPGSVVIGHLKSGCIYVGNPARVIPQKD